MIHRFSISDAVLPGDAHTRRISTGANASYRRLHSYEAYLHVIRRLHPVSASSIRLYRTPRKHAFLLWEQTANRLVLSRDRRLKALVVALPTKGLPCDREPPSIMVSIDTSTTPSSCTAVGTWLNHRSQMRTALQESSPFRAAAKWLDDPSDAVVPIVETKIEIAFEQGITAQSEVGRSCVRGSGDVRSVPFSSDL